MTFNSAELAQVLEVGSDQHYLVVFDPTGAGNGPERAYITAHDAGATVATIVRGREGGVGGDPVEHAQDTMWAISPCASDYMEIVTNATHPSGNGLPYIGQPIYDIDDDALLIYNKSLAFEKPWNMPWGFIEEDRSTGLLAAGIGATPMDVNLGLTFTRRKNRRYSVLATGEYVGSNLETFGAVLADGGNTSLKSLAQVILTAAGGFSSEFVGQLNAHYEFTAGASGSITLKVRSLRASGVGLADFRGTSVNPAIISVHDIGPDGASDG